MYIFIPTKNLHILFKTSFTFSEKEPQMALKSELFSCCEVTVQLIDLGKSLYYYFLALRCIRFVDTYFCLYRSCFI